MVNCGELWCCGVCAYQACNTSSCAWDGGDCANGTKAVTGYKYAAATPTVPLTAGYCATGCPPAWLGDMVRLRPPRVPMSCRCPADIVLALFWRLCCAASVDGCLHRPVAVCYRCVIYIIMSNVLFPTTSLSLVCMPRRRGGTTVAVPST